MSSEDRDTGLAVAPSPASEDLGNSTWISAATLASRETESSFDYGTVSSGTAFLVRKAAERIRKRTYDAYIENGRDLTAIKEKLGHGFFGPWLRAELQMSERTAQNLMAAVELVDSKNANIADLPVTAIYRLAARSTPETVREEILARVAEGERLTVKDISSAVRDAQAREAERQRQSRLTPAQRRYARKKQDEIEREDEQRRLQMIEEEAAADGAIELLTDRLGDDLSEFLGLVTKAGWWAIQSKLRGLRS